MNGLALALLLQAPSPAPPCVSDGCFMVQVQDINKAPVAGISVTLEANGKTGTAVSTTSGQARVCLPGVAYGDTARAIVTPAAYRLQFPPNGRVGLACEAPSLFVCKEQGCGILTLEQVKALIGSLRPQAQALDEAQVQALFREMAEAARQQGETTAALYGQLLRKERQVTAAGRAQRLLSRFGDRARELLVRFDRHAMTAVTQPAPQPFQQLNDAFTQYNAVFQELQADGDGCIQEVADQWQPTISGGVLGLVTEARAFHQAEIFPLNEATTRINACIHKWPDCSNRQASLQKIAQAVEQARSRSIPALDRYAEHLASWKQSVRVGLYESE